MGEETLLAKEDWEVIQSLLPDDWKEMCKVLGAYQRTRKFAGPANLLRALLIHCAEGCSYRVTAAVAEEGGLAAVSDVALTKRLRLASDWLQWLGSGVVKKWLQPPDHQAYDGPLHVKLADATTVQEQGSKGTSWRIHFSLELSSLKCNEVVVTGKEKGESFQNFEVQEGDLWLGDRGYAKPPGIRHVIEHDGDVLVRVGWSSMAFFQENGDRFDLIGHLRGLKGNIVGDWPVFLDDGEDRIAGRICAIRKSVLATERERKRILRESSKRGRKTKPETLEAAQYIVLFTTLDQSIPAETVMIIYRLRWQIELTFKRLKSLLGLGHLHNNNPESAKAWLHGKLLAACLIEALAVVSENFSPWGYPLGEKTQPLAQRLEGDSTHVQVLPASSDACLLASLPT